MSSCAAVPNRPTLTPKPSPTDCNLLLITLDQLRADVLFGALHEGVGLPALDRLMAEGVRFEQCYAAAVPCGPARASLLTGLHAFNHRVIRNGAPLAEHHATLGTELRKLGREPLLFGYCDIAADPTVRHPRDPDLRTYELPIRGFRELAEMRFEAPMNWIGHLRRRGYAVPEPMPERVHELFRPLGQGLRAPAFYRAEDSDTAVLTDQALQALEARRDAPWTAHLTWIRPHPPLVAPEPYNQLIDAARLPAARPVSASWAAHPFSRAWFSEPVLKDLYWGFDGRAQSLSAQQVADLRAIYLGLVAEVDHHLGRVLDWLDATGQTERTWIVLLSDHGEMLGDLGFWGKEHVHRAAHHVPLVIRGPGVQAGYRVPHVVSSIDVAATVLDLLGAPIPAAVDGRSLRDFLYGTPPPNWTELALTAIDFADPQQPTRFERALKLDALQANAAVLRDARYTLVHFNGGLPPLLFDRSEDPFEEHDLSRTPTGEQQIARLRSALVDLMLSRKDRRLTGEC